MTTSPQEADQSTLRILAVDDNIVVRTGLVALLEAADGIEVVGEAGNGAEALTMTRAMRPDVVLLDVRMPVRDGVSVVEELSGLTKVIMLTHTEDPEIIQTALRRGAKGYLVHGNFGLEELARALNDVAGGVRTPLSSVAATAVVASMLEGPVPTAPQEAGVDLAQRYSLSERELEILQTMARGYTNAEIASELYVAEKTVKNHLNRIFHKLGVSTRTAAIALWHERV
ncbi:response regulator [Nocardiopsis suaedae]|uniref:Response regulator transcription factor n=1 Tax=Nocardiopsis suaedae TaxID=3018444 RepID=A0ABT4TRG9_9ACTN|nr:response regulator transcription factor [Nocardiopsis suaedae]MDA2807271.1 response regulator transcription factor [Nocardiopsis suaedae]